MVLVSLPSLKELNYLIMFPSVLCFHPSLLLWYRYRPFLAYPKRVRQSQVFFLFTNLPFLSELVVQSWTPSICKKKKSYKPVVITETLICRTDINSDIQCSKIGYQILRTGFLKLLWGYVKRKQSSTEGTRERWVLHRSGSNC